MEIITLLFRMEKIMVKKVNNSNVDGNFNYLFQFENLYMTNNEMDFKNVSKMDEKSEKILKGAVEGNNEIFMFKSYDGFTIQCGNNGFCVTTASVGEREMIYWKDALDELLKNGMIEQVDYKGELFEVKKRGYEYYDKYIKESMNN